MGVQLSNYFTTYTIYNVTRTSFMYFSPAPPPPPINFVFIQNSCLCIANLLNGLSQLTKDYYLCETGVCLN